jgi:hypothetical protein
VLNSGEMVPQAEKIPEVESKRVRQLMLSQQFQL